MKNRILFISLFFISLGLSGCALPTNDTAPVPSVTPFNQNPPTTSTALPTSVSEETCPLADINLDAWKQGLPYSEIILVPQIYQGQTSLIVWYPDLALSQASPAEIDTQAAQSALSTAKQLSIVDDCLFAFESVYITVVDSSYQLRFSGSIRTADLPQTLVDAPIISDEETGGGQALPIDENSAGSGQACQWTLISANLGELLSERTISSAFSLVRDAGGTNMTAYLQFSASPGDNDLPGLIETIYAGIGCLQSSVNGISIAITLPDSQLVLTGYQPLTPDDGYDPSTFTFTRFDAQ